MTIPTLVPFPAFLLSRHAQSAGRRMRTLRRGGHRWGTSTKLAALSVSCLLFFSMPAHANDVGTFNAMVALANKGDAEAQYHVGMMHNNGIGTRQDLRQAFA